MKKILFLAIIFILITACINKPEIIKTYEITRNDIIDDTLAVFQKDISFDENGSLMFQIDNPEIIHLYETGDLDLESCWLEYSVQIQTENVQGAVYLEMWCVIAANEYFSRSLNHKISGTNNWQITSTPFFLKKGQNPTNIKLNLVFDGKGIVWIDDIKLIKRRI